MDLFRAKQQKRVGVGGMKCPCCNDYHGMDKPLLNRLARRELKRELKKEEGDTMSESIKVSRLSFKNEVGSGRHVYAYIDKEVNCAEFTMKSDCEQRILEEPENPAVISYEPFIQFAPKAWDNMLDDILPEMVGLWNDKHATGDTDE